MIQKRSLVFQYTKQKKLKTLCLKKNGDHSIVSWKTELLFIGGGIKLDMNKHAKISHKTFQKWYFNHFGGVLKLSNDPVNTQMLYYANAKTVVSREEHYLHHQTTGKTLNPKSVII